MEIKSYASLSADERYAVRHFFEMFKGPTLSKNENDVHAYMTMMDLESGALFFTVWQDKQVIATLGVVLVALATRSEAYLTGAALRNSNSAIEAMKELVNHCENLVMQAMEKQNSSNQTEVKIKMGVGPRIAWLRPSAESWGFVLKERMHHLVFDVTQNPLSITVDGLQMIPLNHENKVAYIAIHNRSFESVPNGGMTTLEVVEKQIEEPTDNTWHGLFFDLNAHIPVGFYELKMKDESGRVGWIESIGVDDAFQGKGFGKKALLAGVRFLSEKGAEQVELLVMDSNIRAEKLYLSQGFQLKQVFNQWYEKKREVARK